MHFFPPLNKVKVDPDTGKNPGYGNSHHWNHNKKEFAASELFPQAEGYFFSNRSNQLFLEKHLRVLIYRIRDAQCWGERENCHYIQLPLYILQRTFSYVPTWSNTFSQNHRVFTITFVVGIVSFLAMSKLRFQVSNSLA